MTVASGKEVEYHWLVLFRSTCVRLSRSRSLTHILRRLPCCSSGSSVNKECGEEGSNYFRITTNEPSELNGYIPVHIVNETSANSVNPQPIYRTDSLSGIWVAKIYELIGKFSRSLPNGHHSSIFKNSQINGPIYKWFIRLMASATQAPAGLRCIKLAKASDNGFCS